LKNNKTNVDWPKLQINQWIPFNLSNQQRQTKDENRQVKNYFPDQDYQPAT
jgi:hypothetical protein